MQFIMSVDEAVVKMRKKWERYKEEPTCSQKQFIQILFQVLNKCLPLLMLRPLIQLKSTVVISNKSTKLQCTSQIPQSFSKLNLKLHTTHAKNFTALILIIIYCCCYSETDDWNRAVNSRGNGAWQLLARYVTLPYTATEHVWPLAL